MSLLMLPSPSILQSILLGVSVAVVCVIVKISHLLATRTKTRRTSIDDFPASRERKAAPSTTNAKPDQWYRDLFYRLHNLEEHGDVLGVARDELLSMFSRAISLGARQKHGSILNVTQYEPEAVQAFIQQQHDTTMTEWENYLDKRQRGFGPALFGSREGAKKWLMEKAPVKFVDGAWLSHMNKITTPFHLRKFTKDAWQIFSEELGDGDLSKHHVYLYQQLLKSVGCNLPDGHSADFVKPELWEGLNTRHAWEGAISQLLASLFPNEFLPEALGFNMHFEMVTLETMQAAYELRALNIDPSYFLLHIAIDNADSGHTAMATQIVTQFLDRTRAEEGEEAASQAWKRVQTGFMLSQHLGEAPPTVHAVASPAVHDIPLDELSANVSGIFKAKAAVSQQIHCPSRVRLGGRSLTEWLDQRTWADADKDQQVQLLTELALTKPWVYPGASKKSHLLRALSWKGKMYGAFTHEETATLAAWIDSLGPDAGAWMYWRFTGRTPVGSNDAVAGVWDPAGHYTSILTQDEVSISVPMPISSQSREPDMQYVPWLTQKLSTATPDKLFLNLIPLWFAHVGLLENTLSVPSRTTTPIHAALLRLRRAEIGFELETDIVAGTDEMRRPTFSGLFEVGLDMLSTLASTTNKNIELDSIWDALKMTNDIEEHKKTTQFVQSMLVWSLRPVQNLGLLLGLSLAFLDFKEALRNNTDLFSEESQIILSAIIDRERKHLNECKQLLQDTDEAQYENLDRAYDFGHAMLQECF